MQIICFRFELVTLLPGDREDSRFETTIRGDRPLEVKQKPILGLKWNLESSCKFSPEKSFKHISLSARSVLLLNNQRLCNLLQLFVEIALCLNWIDECIVTAIVFVSFFSIYYDIDKTMSKGKVKQFQKSSMQLFSWSIVCRCHLYNWALRPGNSGESTKRGK